MNLTPYVDTFRPEIAVAPEAPGSVDVRPRTPAPDLAPARPADDGAIEIGARRTGA
ncbi:hypothetical protein ACFZBU_34545 [Embleya sp. NPDC008237]|uniref:hypothetical protein n=1 Tax=Embleya sp. NPDC008237 TaxID=3363978 RepID=UPI0036E92758